MTAKEELLRRASPEGYMTAERLIELFNLLAEDEQNQFLAAMRAVDEWEPPPLDASCAPHGSGLDMTADQYLAFEEAKAGPAGRRQRLASVRRRLQMKPHEAAAFDAADRSDAAHEIRTIRTRR